MIVNILLILAIPLFLLISYLVFNLYKRLNLFGVFNKENRTLLDRTIIVVVMAISVWAVFIIMTIIIHILGFE